MQPQLLLLQKNMLIAEGVSRQLNPRLNIWTLAQPLIEEWMVENRGPPGARAQARSSELGPYRRAAAGGDAQPGSVWSGIWRKAG